VKGRAITARGRADRLLAEGREAHAAGENARALRLYRKATAIDPNWSVPHYNIGFVHKYARRWKESLAANLRAHQLDPEDEAAAWNAAIAATALADWKTVRKLWKSRGIDLPRRSGDPAGNFGAVVIRINPEGDGETVWGRRIDPVRAILLNIPLPNSGHFLGDLVLHDGAAEGYREHQGRQVPVFNALQRLKRSELRTYAAEVAVDSHDEIEALEALGRESNIPFEDWTSMQTVCLRCSYGVPHRHRRAKGRQAAEWTPRRQVAIAARSAREARALLDRWAQSGEGREVRLFYAARVARAKVQPRAQWWNSSTFITETDSSAETH
jgi:tetratricopeptide (TPR) repeat protein